MCFILKLMLIILLNKTHAYITQNTETILLPALYPTDAKEILLTLKAFGKLIQLNLRRNDQIVSPAFEAWKYNANGATENLSQLKASDPCVYLHEDQISSAAINFCDEHGLEGLVFMKNDTLEIRSLRNEFKPLCLINNFGEQANVSFGKPHRIKKLQSFAHSNLHYLENFILKHIQETQKKLTIELAVFFDEEAYHEFMPLLDNDKEKLRNMILAYVNQIQAAFHHPSLGVPIDISLVRLDIMEKQPSNLPVFPGDVDEVLSSFCDYASSLNPPDDNDPHHWDIGLYLTGLNLYEVVNNRVEHSTSGHAYINAACNPFFSCVVIELRPSLNAPGDFSGFASFRIALHEIGHLLGMEDDSPNWKLDAKVPTYIMSPRRYYRNQITWSEGSRNRAEELWEKKRCLRDNTRPKNLDDADALNHSRYHDLPGREWTAKAQCELLLSDKDANVIKLLDICQALECEKSDSNYYYLAGPALDGTYCAVGKECRGGECVPVVEPPYIFKYSADDNWSEWKEDSCKSGCLEKSKGVLVKRRFCKHGAYRTANCIGSYYDMDLCDDSVPCFLRRRKTIAEFTKAKCTHFSGYMLELEQKPGQQAHHQVDTSWIACVIFCQRKNFSTYYAPIFEMLNIDVNPFFPDGTWCHRERNQNYFCRKHHCLPESYTLKKDLPT